MIKPEELRIGNWVCFKSWRKEVDKYIYGNVVSIDIWHPNKTASIVYSDEDNGLGAHNTGMNFEKLIPIPLTPEILVKLGFSDRGWNKEENLYLDITDTNGSIATTDNGGFEIIADHEDSYYTLPLKIKYLHQLQNLYFALTGNELIYNP